MLVPMTKVAIVGHHAALEATIAALRELALLHVLDASAAPELHAGPMTLGPERAAELETLRKLTSRVDALTALRDRAGLPPLSPPPQRDEPCGLDELAARVAPLVPRAEALAQRIADLEAEQNALPRHLASLEKLAPLGSDLVETESYETVAMVIDRQHAELLDRLREEVDQLTEHRFEMTTGVVDRDTVGALLVFPRSCSSEVHELLGSGQVSRVSLPKGYEGLSFKQSLQRMEQRKAAIPNEIESLREEVASLFEASDDLTSVRRAAERRVAELELLRHLGTSDETFSIVGWLPALARERLAETLEARGLSATMVLELDVANGEEPPVLLENHAIAEPFVELVKLFGWPRAGSIDPSLLMTLFMPLFFGMMLGDIGYGAVLLALALGVGRRFPKASAGRRVTRFLAMGAGWAVVWGVLFGELLGDFGERWLGLHALWLPRGEAQAIGPLLVFALAVGGAHVGLGLALGIFTAWRKKHRGELLERIGLMLALSSLFLLTGVVAGALPDGLLTPSIAGLLVGTVLVGVTKGALGILMGPLEVVSGLGNVLSYLRIAAIGLASVYLARVANELAAEAPAILGVIVATLLHALNLALGAFSPTIQALRLHYVEFFGKFYDEGGTPYRPFGLDLCRDPAAPP